MKRRFLLYVAAALAATAVILAVIGGFRTTVGGLRISARSPLPIAFLAFINFTLWLSWARRAQAIESDLQAVWERVERHTAIVLAIALIVMTVTAIFATRSAAGADASGYVSQAAATIATAADTITTADAPSTPAMRSGNAISNGRPGGYVGACSP